MMFKSGLSVLAALILVGSLGLSGASPAWGQDETADDDSNYRIGADDVLRIVVWQRRDLSGEYQIDQEGNLTMPLAGTLHVSGMTAQELAVDLERRLVIMDPAVSQVLVTVVGYHSRRFTVVGEVRNPGTYNFRELPNLWDVILMAGGQTPGADMSSVQIRREAKDGGPAQTLTFDLSGGLEGTPEADVPELVPGDQVVVPGLLGGGGLANQIQVLGAVRNPGSYSLRVAPTVVKAVSISGGHMEFADLESVQLTRPTPQGAQVFKLNVKNYLEGGYPRADLSLRAGDTVTVPSRAGGFTSTLTRALQFTGFLSTAAALIVAVNNLNN